MNARDYRDALWLTWTGVAAVAVAAVAVWTLRRVRADFPGLLQFPVPAGGPLADVIQLYGT